MIVPGPMDSDPHARAHGRRTVQFAGSKAESLQYTCRLPTRHRLVYGRY